VLRPIAGPVRELHVTDLSGARERARLVAVICLFATSSGELKIFN